MTAAIFLFKSSVHTIENMHLSCDHILVLWKDESSLVDLKKRLKNNDPTLLDDQFDAKTVSHLLFKMAYTKTNGLDFSEACNL